MELPESCLMVRVFIGESDKWQHKPLHEAIVLKAREMNLAGATVLRGMMGYGKSTRLHTSKVLRLSLDLPMIVEIVDRKERLETFLPILKEMVGDGLVTIENVKVFHYQGTEE